MSPPISLRQIASWLGAASSVDVHITNFAADSRRVKPGGLFFALRGAKVDGHAFLAEVKAKGAGSAVVALDYQGADHGLHLIRVPDVLAALQRAATQRLALFRPLILAVTGSVGKTTTKGFAVELLRHRYRVLAAPGNENTQVSLPLLLLNAEGNEEVAVLEMGMTGKGQIANLVQMAPPAAAVLLSVAHAHTAFFHTIEDIARAKAEIFSHPNTKIGFVNAQIPGLEEVKAIGSCSKTYFSTTSREAEFFAEQRRNAIQIYHKGRGIVRCSWHLPGAHNVQNFMGAALLANVAGMEWEEIACHASTLQLPPMRLQHLEHQGVMVINDTYNAHPVSVCAALDSLPAPSKGGRTIAVLSEMLELGKFQEESHRMVAIHALPRVDLLYCIGDGASFYEQVWKEAKRPVRRFSDRQQLLTAVKAELRSGDVVLFKGGRRYAFEELVSVLIA